MLPDMTLQKYAKRYLPVVELTPVMLPSISKKKLMDQFTSITNLIISTKITEDMSNLEKTSNLKVITRQSYNWQTAIQSNKSLIFGHINKLVGHKKLNNKSTTPKSNNTMLQWQQTLLKLPLLSLLNHRK